jgi:hypothetical protein
MRHSIGAWFTLAAVCAAVAALGLRLSADARRDDPPTNQDVATRLLQTGLREQGAYATLETLLSRSDRA